MNRRQRRHLASLKRRGLLTKGLHLNARTQQQLNAEYTAICGQLGQITEVRSRLDKDEEALLKRLEALHAEAETLKASEAKAEEAAPVEAPAAQEAVSVVQG